nr:MAG TPA: putative acyltransferase [Caudoviricetes sp.]
MIVNTVKSKVGYRSDIDGLRAIAVVAVILYHFGGDC